ncbi:MAG: glycosyl transferase family 90 [Cyclobacteriaceae bacterium]
MRNSSGRNNKLAFYVSGLLREALPDSFYRILLPGFLNRINDFQAESFFDRVNYYNRLQPGVFLPEESAKVGDLKWPRKGSAYYLDAREAARYFHPGLKANYLFGDITHIPEHPAFLKSRPVSTENENSVLLKLNKVRHFAFINDTVPFDKKINRLIGRAEVKQKNRIRFYEQYFDHPMMDLGQINRGTNHDAWLKTRISIPDHLHYKFILCLEGFDVATNLKWVMSSSSLAVMPPPAMESWFMEGKLIADFHYVSVRPDFSDVEERLQYYIQHPEEAKQIVRNANAWVMQFIDSEAEFLMGIAVMLKYFQCTGQTPVAGYGPADLLPDFSHIRG